MSQTKLKYRLGYDIQLTANQYLDIDIWNSVEE